MNNLEKRLIALEGRLDEAEEQNRLLHVEWNALECNLEQIEEKLDALDKTKQLILIGIDGQIQPISSWIKELKEKSDVFNKQIQQNTIDIHDYVVKDIDSILNRLTLLEGNNAKEVIKDIHDDSKIYEHKKDIDKLYEMSKEATAEPELNIKEWEEEYSIHLKNYWVKRSEVVSELQTIQDHLFRGDIAFKMIEKLIKELSEK